jgi:eukaryotic-like serine/threonine-protein kinase
MNPGSPPDPAEDDRTVVTPRPGSAAGGSATGPLAVGQAFGARYHVIKVLGVGGMGAVYQVWDAELGQGVALKVIRPEAAGDAEAVREMERRFKQELVLARQVTHKNVVRIHDLGEINGIKYITMPYLEGSDLATVLKRDGKLALPVALPIIRDVVAGLVAAHEAGIVHRDLKPANIMLVGTHAIIRDFGIARSASGEAPD